MYSVRSCFVYLKAGINPISTYSTSHLHGWQAGCAEIRGVQRFHSSHAQELQPSLEEKTIEYPDSYYYHEDLNYILLLFMLVTKTQITVSAQFRIGWLCVRCLHILLCMIFKYVQLYTANSKSNMLQTFISARFLLPAVK